MNPWSLRYKQPLVSIVLNELKVHTKWKLNATKRLLGKKEEQAKPRREWIKKRKKKKPTHRQTDSQSYIHAHFVQSIVTCTLHTFTQRSLRSTASYMWLSYDSSFICVRKHINVCICMCLTYDYTNCISTYYLLPTTIHLLSTHLCFNLAQ